MNSLDKIINIVSALFLLSFVVENITFFMRKYFYPKTAIKVPWFKKFWYGDEVAEAEMGQNEAPIQVIGASMFFGILVAYLFNANMIKMMGMASGNPLESIQPIWEMKSPLLVGDVVGIVATGIFLSLGSKVFHDLLDLLLQIKNTRKAIATGMQDFANMKSADGVKGLLSPKNIAEHVVQYIDTHMTQIKAWGKVVRVNGFIGEYDGKLVNGIRVGLADADISKVPSNVEIMLPDGSKATVPVEIIPNLGGSVTNAIACGDKIRNKVADTDDYGSVGIPLVSPETGSHYVCTCYHVVNKEGSWAAYEHMSHDDAVIVNRGGKHRGKVIFSAFDAQHDFSFIKLHEEEAVDTNLWGRGNTRDWRKTTQADVRHTLVRMRGATSSGIKSGKIHDTGVRVLDIAYPNEQRVDLYDLIELEADGGGPLSQPGDSGALVVAEDNLAIGMIVASNTRFSYAMPIWKIMEYPTLTGIKINA